MHIQAKLVVGIIGNIASMAVYVSPAPTMIKIFKMKSTQEFSGLPYACALLNCLVWVLYGTPLVRPHGLLIVSVNAFGVFTELVFISTYMAFAINKSKVKMTRYIVAVLTFYGLCIVVVLLGLHSIPLRQVLVGSLGVIVSVAMYGAPLSMMGLVIRTKSVEFMPFTLASCNFFNSATWLAYAFVTKDIFIAIPSGIGCICGIMQFLLYGIFYRKHPCPVLKTESNECGTEPCKGSLCLSIHEDSILYDGKEDVSELPKMYNGKEDVSDLAKMYNGKEDASQLSTL